ncbi:MAG: hypothetical protein KAJ03_04675 [Gammaproteobacteria bacterium]|nr:hypothetical protein [Gammaproteobacteria bacterium]
MNKYAAIFVMTSITSITLLGSYIWWVYTYNPQAVTIWNAWLPLLGALVLLTFTLATGTLMDQERAQASTNTEHYGIDVVKTLVHGIKGIKEDAPFYITAIVEFMTIVYGLYLFDTQPESLLAQLIIIPVLGLGMLMLYFRYNEEDIDISEYAKIDDNRFWDT